MHNPFLTFLAYPWMFLFVHLLPWPGTQSSHRHLLDCLRRATLPPAAFGAIGMLRVSSVHNRGVVHNRGPMPFLRRASTNSPCIRNQSHAGIPHRACCNHSLSVQQLFFLSRFVSRLGPLFQEPGLPLFVAGFVQNSGDFLYEEQYAVQILKNLVLGPLKINYKI